MPRGVPNLSTVVSKGDRRRSLERLRDHLAAELEKVDADKAAPLARELRATLADLEAIPEPAKATTADDLKRRREARRAAAAGAPAATGTDERRGGGGRARK